MLKHSIRKLGRATHSLGVLGVCLFAGANLCAEHASLTEARKALAEGIPQVAVYTLQGAMAAPGFPANDRSAARRLLAEAQLAKGDSAAALETLATFTDATDANATLLRAHAYAAEGRWSEALPIYQSLNSIPGISSSAAVGEAESQQALGRTQDALNALDRIVATGKASNAARLRYASLLLEVERVAESRATLRAVPKGSPSDENWRRYIEARALLLEKNRKAALALLEPMLTAPVGEKPTGLSDRLYAAATIALAEANYVPDNPDAAAKILEAFIRNNPENSQIELIFRRLDQFYMEDKTPKESGLQAIVFAEGVPPNVAALARFYIARMQMRAKNYSKALPSVFQFLAKFPDHPLVPYMYAIRADAILATSKPETEKQDMAAAEAALDAAGLAAKTDDLKAEFALRTARLNLSQREFLRAASHLKTAKESPRLRMSAAYNSALAWLMQGNHELFEKEFEELVADGAPAQLAGSLRLEQGLVKARAKAPDAARALSGFLREYSTHPRKAEAQLALAELAFVQGNQLDAQMYVQTVSQAPQPAEIAGQAEYLAILVEDARQPRDDDRVAGMARNFIARHPTSPLLSQVRMKLGQLYYQKEDFLNASEQFVTLAQAEPNGEYAETALFLAGQCGTKLFNAEAHANAVKHFDMVADRHGKLEPYARLQQAILKSQLGAEDDAVKIYDSMLATTLPPEVRYAAIVGKADNLTTLAKKDPRLGAGAIGAYEQLLAIPEAGPSWRNQAAYKKAKTLQQLGRTDEALLVLNGIIDKNTDGPRETFWLSRAGFEAGSLLEAQQQWKSAVGIYEKMAKIPGAHVNQAKQRVKALQSEHFLWD